jgi:hypothetical protein
VNPLGSTGPKDVASGVHVGVVFVTAGLTTKRCLAYAVRPLDVTALGTSLARVVRIHSHDHPTGTFSLVGDHENEVSPPRVMDGTIKASLSRPSVGQEVARILRVRFWLWRRGHLGNCEILKGDEVKIVNESATELMGGATALVPNLAMQASDRLGLSMSSVAASLLRCQTTLRFGQLYLRLRTEVFAYQ